MTDHTTPAWTPDPEGRDRLDAVAAASLPAPSGPAPGTVTEEADAATPVPVSPVAGGTRGGGARRTLGYVAAAGLGVAIGVVGLAVAGGWPGGRPSPSPAAPTEAPSGDTLGRRDAPVTIEVWADYQCPFCRLEDLLFRGAVEREYVAPGIVRIVFRDFAFLGPESTAAAVAARCAGAQDPAARLRYHDALYTFQQGENQGRFIRDNLVQLAQIAGVADAAAFVACLDDPAVAAAVEAETAAGRDVGITSTPTLRLRGPGGERVLTGFSQAWPTLRDAIDRVATAPPASPAPSAPDGSTSPAP